MDGWNWQLDELRHTKYGPGTALKTGWLKSPSFGLKDLPTLSTTVGKQSEAARVLGTARFASRACFGMCRLASRNDDGTMLACVVEQVLCYVNPHEPWDPVHLAHLQG